MNNILNYKVFKCKFHFHKELHFFVVFMNDILFLFFSIEIIVFPYTYIIFNDIIIKLT